MRFANSIFEPIWDRRYVDHVQITACEDLGVGSRAGYYESSGVMRDMFQNHLLQVIVPGGHGTSRGLRGQRHPGRETENTCAPFAPSPRGKWNNGRCGASTARVFWAGEKVPGYREEEGVKPSSTTPTYAAVKVFLDTWRWHGVPFFLRSGKRLPKRATEVAIQFKEPPNLLFKGNLGELSPNVLVVRIQPDEGITLKFETKVPGMTMEVRTVNMDFRYNTSFAEGTSEAYERLLLDCMLGDATLFIRGDEAEAAWSAVMPILNAWETTRPKEYFPNYEAGTWGPESANALLGQPWREWRHL